MYNQGENVHIAVWPGSRRNTEDISRFMAKEGRSFVISVSALMRREDFPEDTPHLEEILKNCPALLADGGSCAVAPNGNWLLEPQVGEEGLYMVKIDLQEVLEERQNFDPSGHYSRPDVLRLQINRKRQSSMDEFP
jgi:nitrilase